MTSRRDPDIDGRWAWLVLVAIYFCIVLTSVATFGAGVIYVDLLDYYNDSKAKTSIVGALNGGLMCLLGPLASALMNVTSCRVCLILGGLLTSLGFITSFFVRSIDDLILTYGVLGGIGNSFASTSYVVILGYYFEKRRNTVIAMSVGVIGLGFLVAAPLLLYVLEEFGLHGTFLILSGLSAHLCVAGMISKPSSTEKLLKQSRQKSYSNHDNNGGKRACFKLNNVSFKLLSNISLILFLFSTLCWNLTLSVCIIHMPNYIALKNVGGYEISVVMTIFSTTNMAGRFIGACTVGKGGLSSMTLHIGMLGITGIATVTFPSYSHHVGGDYLFAGIIGLYTGGCNSLMTPVTLEMVGVAALSTAHGLEFFFCGIGYLAGPPIAGYLYGLTGSYQYSFIFAGVVVLVGCLLAMGSVVAAGSPQEASVTSNTYQEPTFSEEISGGTKAQTIIVEEATLQGPVEMKYLETDRMLSHADREESFEKDD